MAFTSGGTPILGTPTATAEQMRQYVRSVNPSAPDYADLYLILGRKYNVRGDLAFAQAVLESNFWRFGGSLRAEQNNFAGLGSTSHAEAGVSFPTPDVGIEAQLQHLYGYATTVPLPAGTAVVDPRFNLLESAGLRGIAPHWEDLNGKWAVPGTTYGQDIVRIGSQIQAVPTAVPTPMSPVPQPAPPPAPAPSPQDPNAWKAEAMQWLSAKGLTNSPHNPDSPVTWAEFGTVLRRLMNGGQ